MEFRRGLSVAATLAACASPWSCRERAPSAGGGVPPAAPWFEDVTAASGVDFVHETGHRERLWFPEIMIGGVCMIDYDNDKDLDLYFVQGGDLNVPPANQEGNRLYRNRGNGTFEDVTADAGAGHRGYAMGCTAGDYDADGDVDLYVTNVGPNVLYRNNGDGTFSDVTLQAGVGDPAFTSSASFVDYDADGYADLIVVNYVVWSPKLEVDCFSPSRQPSYCSPLSYKESSAATLYHNNGDGTFTDVSATSGIGSKKGSGLGVVCADFNRDSRMDIYVANDGMENRLWINEGGGRFVDRALLTGCAVNEHGTPEAGMGVTAVDIEHDGDLDLFVGNLRDETNTFYLNEKGLFTDVTADLGLAVPSRIYTTFGVGFADFDHDTVLDLYVANGRVVYRLPHDDPADPHAEPNQLYLGRRDGRFEEFMPRGGTADLIVRTSRAAAFGEIDNDGDLDLVIVNMDAPPTILRNLVGGRGNWIMFRVLQQNGVDAAGAMVRVEVPGRPQWRLVQPAYGYCTGNDPRVHFGLGPATRVETVLVRWPKGTEETFGPFTAGTHYELREGTGR